MSGSRKPGLLLLAALAAATTGAGRDAQKGDPVGHVPEWARPGRCGANCLYVLLRILAESERADRAVTYGEVVGLLPPDNDRGASLADIARASRRLGVPAEVRKVSADDLARLATPFIAHLDLLDQGGTGHFITVHHVQDTNKGVFVHYVDGTTGQMSNDSLANLKPVLTGFVLTPSEAGDMRWLSVVVVVAGLGLGLGGAALSGLTGRRH